MPDDFEPGRPAVEAVFAALLTTAILGVAAVQILAALLPPQASEGSPATAVPLTLGVCFVSIAFAVAQAVLPGPRSTGWFGLAIPLAGAIALAFRGLDPSAIVSALRRHLPDPRSLLPGHPAVVPAGGHAAPSSVHLTARCRRRHLPAALRREVDDASRRPLGSLPLALTAVSCRV
jgi:hypothetical protein